jgi:ABC-type nitrate/sulfonate/bicarbonate transport system substrate-binding protein
MWVARLMCRSAIRLQARRISLWHSFVLWGFFCFLCFEVFAAEPGKLDQIKIGYASISGNRVTLWATYDMGFFARQGLRAELVYVPTSAQGMPALLAGEMPIFLGSADSAAQAVIRGLDLVIVGSTEPTQYKLIAQPGIKSVNELRGKRIGIDRIGSASFFATKRMLDKLGLRAEEVTFLPVPGGGNQRAAAFHSGNLDAVVSTIERFERARIPYFVLADAVSMGIRVQGNSFITTRAFRDQNREVLVKFARAFVEAGFWLKDPRNRESVLKIFSQRLRTSEVPVLNLNYKLYIETSSPFPYTNLSDMQDTIGDLAQENPKFRDLDIAKLVDNTFIRQVQQERETQRR